MKEGREREKGKTQPMEEGGCTAWSGGLAPALEAMGGGWAAGWVARAFHQESLLGSATDLLCVMHCLSGLQCLQNFPVLVR